MAIQFIHKRFPKRENVIIVAPTDKKEEEEVIVKSSKPKNKDKKTKTDMNTVEKIVAAEDVIKNMETEVKVVKKDRGLIERTESSKIILTEDNRQVLND